MKHFNYIEPYEISAVWGKEEDELSAIPYKMHSVSFEFLSIHRTSKWASQQEIFTLTYLWNGEQKTHDIVFNQETLYNMGEDELISTCADSLANHVKVPGIYTYIYEELTDYNEGQKEKQAVMHKVMSASIHKWKTGSPVGPSTPSVADMSMKLPGAMEKVYYPCECRTVGIEVETLHNGAPVKSIQKKIHKTLVWSIVQHLNDYHKWSREKIADWLDELHDKGEINIEFQPWDEDAEKPVENGVKVKFGKTEDGKDTISVAKVYVQPVSENPWADITLDGWQELGYTTDPIEVKFESDLDSVKYKATQHYSLGIIKPDEPIIKGDVL